MRYIVILCAPIRYPGEPLQSSIRSKKEFNTLKAVQRYIGSSDPDGILECYVFDKQRSEYILPWMDDIVEDDVDWVKEGF